MIGKVDRGLDQEAQVGTGALGVSKQIVLRSG